MEKKKRAPAPAGGAPKKRSKTTRLLLIGGAAVSFCAGFAAGFLLSPVKNGILNNQQNYFSYEDKEGKLPQLIADALRKNAEQSENGLELSASDVPAAPDFE